MFPVIPRIEMILTGVGLFRNSRRPVFQDPDRSSHRPLRRRLTPCTLLRYSTRFSLPHIRILVAWNRSPCYRLFSGHLPRRRCRLCRMRVWSTSRRCWTDTPIIRSSSSLNARPRIVAGFYHSVFHLRRYHGRPRYSR